MTISDSKFEMAMARQAMTKAALAEKAGMSRNRLNVVLNSKKVTPMVVGRIAKALGVDVTEILEDESR